MMVFLRLQMVTVIVASSYLTLGVFSPDDARRLWGVYAVVSFVLAVVNLVWERRRPRA